jgi:integrase
VWHESGFVFTTENGQLVDPRNLLRPLKVAAGLKTVSEMLGHSSVAITGDVYQPVSDGAAQAAVDALAAAIGV